MAWKGIFSFYEPGIQPWALEAVPVGTKVDQCPAHKKGEDCSGAFPKKKSRPTDRP